MRPPRHRPVHQVEAMLRRRSIEVLEACPASGLFFPPGLGPEFEDALYTLLKRYSFRIFVREMIRKKTFRAADLLKYSTLGCVEGYLASLSGWGVVVKENGGYRLRADPVKSFGETLEWLVARVFEREFLSPALWGARLGRIEPGGDYDVIAAVEGRLVYVEAKSSPPKNIEEAEVGAFLKRAEALAPDIAIFLEDTRLRMKDKIMPFFESLVPGRAITRIGGETFSIGGRLFVTNSVPALTANIGLCLGERLRQGGLWG